MIRWLAVLCAFVSASAFSEEKDKKAAPAIDPMLEQIAKMRDPFRRAIDPEERIERTELERYSLDRMKVVGVITGAKRLRAMLVTPDGKTHFVSEGMKLGDRNGLVTRISEKGIRVREKGLNVLGQEEVDEQDLLLPREMQMKTTEAAMGPSPNFLRQ
jgi:Tfp pilus assembly protein PilP